MCYMPDLMQCSTANTQTRAQGTLEVTILGDSCTKEHQPPLTDGLSLKTGSTFQASSLSSYTSLNFYISHQAFLELKSGKEHLKQLDIPSTLTLGKLPGQAVIVWNTV